MKNTKFVKEFKIEDPMYQELSKDEKKTLPILLEASKIIADIYADQAQGHDTSLGANLYPSNLSNKVIEEAANKNAEILSPFTVVERGQKGLIAVPYHIKYKIQLEKISQLLFKASNILKDQSFSQYLKTASSSLVSGDYKQMDVSWLTTSDSTLQFLIGPYERYLDKRFFKKMSYLSFVGIKDPYYTKKAAEIHKILFSMVGDQPHRFTLSSKTQICSVRNIFFSGFLAEALISTEHIPSDDQIIRRYGSRLLCYLSTMDYKFDNYLYPIFNLIFEERFRESFSDDILRKANYYLMIVYGLSRQLHRYEGSRERLKELFPIFDEANSMVSGLQHCKHLILKGVINQKQLEAMIIMHICWSFSEWVFAKLSKLRYDFLRGDALALSFYFQNEALREFNGISWPNFSKIFFVIESLSTIFVRLLSQGTYAQAEKFLKENLSYSIFKSFDSKLSKVKIST